MLDGTLLLRPRGIRLYRSEPGGIVPNGSLPRTDEEVTMLVLIDPEPGKRGKIFLPPNSARSQLIWMPFSPTLIALFVPGAAMKRSREPARRRVLRELDRRLYQRGQAAMKREPIRTPS
jgi:hypothetical protein